MSLGIDTINMTHDAAQVGMGGFQQQMIVVSHQTVGMDHTLKALMRLRQGIQKGLIILCIAKNGLARPATVHDMIKGMLIFDALRSGHGESVGEGVL